MYYNKKEILLKKFLNDFKLISSKVNEKIELDYKCKVIKILYDIEDENFILKVHLQRREVGFTNLGCINYATSDFFIWFKEAVRQEKIKKLLK